MCRLDYFIISNDLVNIVNKSEIKPSFKSDHSLACITLNFESIERGPGIFKLNNSLLLDTEYKALIIQSINEIRLLNTDANPLVRWELIKSTIRNETLKFSKYKKKQKTEQINNLVIDIEKLETKVAHRFDEDINRNLELKKAELEQLYNENINGIITRIKSYRIENSEKNIKLLKQLETRNAEKKLINNLNVNGKIISNQNEILNEQKNYYENLYNEKKQNDSEYNFYDENKITKLSENEKLLCEGIITEKECTDAIREMKNGKSPGSDGINVEFYKIFWNHIKKDVIESMNYSFENNVLSQLQAQSLITLIPKPNKDLSFLSNWRPISLLNVDYKILTKVIANRIKLVLNNLIDSSQTGFIKGRYIGENIRLIYDVIEYAEKHNKAGILFFADFEKAFDSLNHKFIFKTLDLFNFGPNLKSWVSLIYKNPTSCILYNGFLSDSFSIKRGVRQGCPLSPYIFILSIELLSIAIRKNKNIKGFKIFDIEVKNSMFADDATVLLDGSNDSFRGMLYIFEQFSLISGLKLNYDKCTALRIGSLRNQHDLIYSRKKHGNISWTSESVKTLGVIFHPLTNEILKLNYDNRLNQFQKDINRWKGRHLTTIGNISILKSLIIPKLTFLLSVLPNPSNQVIKTITQKSYEFIWSSKRDKVKRDIVIQEYKNGGLNMIDLPIFLNSIKSNWIKRIINETNKGLWKEILKKHLKQLGGISLFKYNINTKDITNLKIESKFIFDILVSWSSINFNENPKNISEQILWQNSKIKNNNCLLYFKSWTIQNINYIKDIYISTTNKFKTFNQLKLEYNISDSEFLNYHRLIKAIPIEWKRKLNNNIMHDITISDEINIYEVLEKTKSRNLNTKLTKIQKEKRLASRNEKTKSQQKWENLLPENCFNWKEIYPSAFFICNDNTLQNFYYNFVHRNIATNKFLFKCKLVESSLCDFCNMEVDSIEHLFWSCQKTQIFWNELFKWLIEIGVDITQDKFLAFFHSKNKITSYILLFAKYYIYKCKTKKKVPNNVIFKLKLYNRISLEKYRALQNDCLDVFNTEWSNFLVALNI